MSRTAERIKATGEMHSSVDEPGIGAAIDHGPVDPFRLAASELFLELTLGTWCDRLVWDERALIQKETHRNDPNGLDAIADYRVVERFATTWAVSTGQEARSIL